MERFWSKVDKRGPAECWPWLASVRGPGYGQFRLNGRYPVAHRVAYELVVGPIPVGMQLDHLCRNPSCVNPAHLEPVTARENVLRGEGKAAVNARKTHCKRGHPLSGENLLVDERRGLRSCRACKNAQSAARGRTRTLAKGGVPGKGQYQKARTHCPRGHPYDDENTYIQPKSGKRACRACKRASNAARRAAIQEQRE